MYGKERFAPAADEFAPDLVHAHFATQPTAAASELADELGVPFTFTAHGHDIYRKPPDDFAARAARASAVVTVAHANVRHLVDRFGVPAEHLRVIPCGVDTARFRPSRAAVSPPWIVCVARLSPVKNHLVLLDACAALREAGLEFRCLFVGEGRTREELETARARLGLEDHVVLAGAATQREVLSYWRRAAIAALSSDSEGVPVSLMEAAACAVPAVATAVGGVPELVDDGITGLLVPPGDAAAFAAALELLLRDPDLAMRLGTSARRTVEERFSLAGQVEQLLQVWDEVLA